MRYAVLALFAVFFLPYTWVNAADSRNEVETAEGRPHIILFLVDDLGRMDTSVPFVVDAYGFENPGLLEFD